MSLPPLVLDLRVAAHGKRPVRLWLPLFLLWPLALVLWALAVVVALVADGILLAVGHSYHRYSVLLVRVGALLCHTSGTVIRISNERTAVDMTVK